MRQCVILAGGTGSRLTSQGVTTPKILIDFYGRKLIEFILEELEYEGYTDLLLCLGYQAEYIKKEINKISTNINITFFIESRQSGTLGALVQAFNLLESNFTLLMGDCFVLNTNLAAHHDFACYSDADAILLCKYTDHPQDSDIVEIDEWSTVVKISKPPHKENIAFPQIGMAGVYFLKKDIHFVKQKQVYIKEHTKFLLTCGQLQT